MEKRTIDTMNKLASILEARPYHMVAAATALRKWVTNTCEAEETPTFPHLCLRPGVPLAASGQPAAHSCAFRGALGLEPEPSMVRIVNMRPRLVGDDVEASAEGRFVYDLAHDMVRDHGMAWPAAIATGERAWQHLLAQGLGRPLQEAADTATVSDGDEDVGAPLVLDVDRPAA